VTPENILNEDLLVHNLTTILINLGLS